MTNREITLRLAFLLVLLAMAATIPLAHGECLIGTPADPFEVERAGLSREWIVQLPFDSDGYRLDRVDVDRSTIVAQSGDGKVHAVQVAVADESRPGSPPPGSLLWSTSLGQPLAELQPVGVGSGLVVVNRDMDVVGLDARNGSVFWRRRLPAPPSTGSLPVDDWVYVPLRTRVVLRLPANPFRQPPVAESGDGSGPAAGSGGRQVVDLSPVELSSRGLIEQQPAAYAGGVFWCTRDGHFAAIEPADSSWVRHDFNLQQQPGGPVLVEDQRVFTTTETGELVRCEDTPGGLRLVWSTLLETAVLPNANRPQMLLAGNQLIVSLGEEGIAAHAADSGRRNWRSKVCGNLLAVVGDRAWCLSKQNLLVGLNLTDGTAAAFLAPGPFTVPVTNQASERLVLASPRGLLVSLGPRLIAGQRPASAGPTPETGDEESQESPPTPDAAGDDSDAAATPDS